MALFKGILARTIAAHQRVHEHLFHVDEHAELQDDQRACRAEPIGLYAMAQDGPLYTSVSAAVAAHTVRTSEQ